MIYEFKSRATGTVIMTEAIGEQMLEIIGKSPGRTGVITVAEMPAAMAALKNHNPGPPPGEGTDDDNPAEAAERVSYQQRAWPLIDMIEQARKAGKDITWGV